MAVLAVAEEAYKTDLILIKYSINDDGLYGSVRGHLIILAA
jgi:hypothetical protein